MFGLFKKKKKELSDEELNLQIQTLEEKINDLDIDGSHATNHFLDMVSSIYQQIDKDKFKVGGKINSLKR